MSLETDLQEAIRQHAASRDLWQQQSTLHEQKRNQLGQAVDGYLLNARSEYPFFRVLPNQQLLKLSSGYIDGWSNHGLAPGGVTVVDTIISGQDPLTRTEDAQSLFDAMGLGRANSRYVSHKFNILKLALSQGRAPGIHFPLTNSMTSAAWVKLLSGTVQSGWAQGAELGKWKLTGLSIPQSGALTYTGNHPYVTSATCILLVALPTTVSGFFDLSKKNWGVFPYLKSETATEE